MTNINFRFKLAPMLRQLRMEYPGAIYHIMSRGNRRQDIFLDDPSLPPHMIQNAQCKGLTPSIFLLAGLLVFGTAQTPQARAAAGPGLELRNGVCQLYTGDSLTPAALIRVNAVHRDYETRGFFRLGVLPLEVADGVVIEIYDSASVAKCLSQFKRVLFGRGAGRTEVRQLEVRVAGP
ncbi:MAG: hypothetical protein ACREIC_03075, partial [Limisphaerales bacterium]